MTDKTQKPATGERPNNGTGRGRNKSREKKRAYQQHCYAMRTSGHITDAFGSWFIPPASDQRARGTTEK